MWYWKLQSDVYGSEEFGGYDTKEEALEGIARVKENARQLNDGVEREYSEPYTK